MCKTLSVDLGRILRRRFCENPVRVVCEFFLMPALVALVITLAFILRYTPVQHREGLAFFATLYAFWCGLFGSCQSINTELATGEWSYWVLGMRRRFGCHLLAHIFSGILTAFLQVTACVAAIGAINFLTGGLVMQNLCNVYFSTDVFFQDILNACSGFWAMTGTNRYLALEILYLAMFVALISGVGFGILFSTFFKEPITSLNVSVAFIVILAILSYTTLHDPSRKDVTYNPPGETPRSFMPLYLTLRQENLPYKNLKIESDLGKRRDADVLENISWAFPQRYFFNIARLTFGNVPYLNRRCGKENNKICRCAKCLGITECDGRWAEIYFSSKIADTATFEPNSVWRETIGKTNADIIAFYQAHGGLCKSNLWDVRSLFGLLKKIIFFETMAVLGIFILTIAGAYLCMKKKEIYYVLR